MDTTGPSINALAGYGFVFGLVAILIGIWLWRTSDGGGNGVGYIILPKFIAGCIVFSMISAAVWWVTRS